MTAIHETAYPRIRSNVTDKELEQIYTPSEEEFWFANQNTQAPVQRLGLLVLLKTFQRLGYFPMLQQIPQRVIHHIATSASLEDVVDNLESYEKVGSGRKTFVRFLDMIPDSISPSHDILPPLFVMDAILDQRRQQGAWKIWTASKLLM